MSFGLLKLLLSSLVTRSQFGTASVTSLGSVGDLVDVIFNCAAVVPLSVWDSNESFTYLWHSGCQVLEVPI